MRDDFKVLLLILSGHERSYLCDLMTLYTPASKQEEKSLGVIEPFTIVPLFYGACSQQIYGMYLTHFFHLTCGY